MDCVNHSGVAAAAYCQNCGKALCKDCVAAGVLRHGSSGQILCDTCITAWQSVQPPFVAPPTRGPNPSAAAVLGLIPGVGAMYNGQFFKGLIHVVIFAVLVSISDHYGIFGIFIGAWILYQSFEAFHTAKALRDGLPLPDPLGLNEVGNWLNLGGRPRTPGAYPPGPASPAGQAPTASGYQTPAPGAYQQGAPYQAPYQASYQAPYTPPSAGFADPFTPPVPPPPPVPPHYWQHKEPIGAIVLIGLGILFLLGQLDLFSGRLLEYTWPLLLIGLGVWLIVRRIGDSQGGLK